MDAQRRRKLAELARVHEQWRAQHEIDDAEFVPAGADSAHRRSPTAEQERELTQRSDEVLGYDPATGRYQTELEHPPVARTDREAQLYMDRRPCHCGEAGFDRSATMVRLPDGGVASRYAAACPRCGRPRVFAFRLPPDPLPATSGFRYGGDDPSQLLDAGEWLLVADEFAGAIPPDPHLLPDADRRQVREQLAAAAAAAAEALKFVPPGQDAVPATALWSERGDSLHVDDPSRFETARLTTEQETYLRMLARLDS